MQTATNILVNNSSENRDGTTLEPIDGRNKQASSALKPKKARLPPGGKLKTRTANKSVDDSMRSNTLHGVDPEGTTQESIAPSPFLQYSTNERPGISAWDNANGRDS